MGDLSCMEKEEYNDKIIRNYIRERIPETPSTKKQKNKKKTKIVACDHTLRLLFQSEKINTIKLHDLVAKHYVENQEDSYDDYIWSPEEDKQHRLSPPSDKIDKEKTTEVVQKPKGKFAAIVRDNIKLVYLRKSLVQELAKTPETFESKVMGTFVRIKNPCQLVQVIGVKKADPIDCYLLQITNYSYYLKDVFPSGLSDDDFSQEECEELLQRINNGFSKRFTVVDMEEKARSLHEDVTKHWIARELVLLQRRINQANEKGWRRELSQYLEKMELLQNPEEQSRLLREVPEVVAEELEPEPECVDDDGKQEKNFMEPDPDTFVEAHQIDEEQQLSDSPVSSIQKTLDNSKLREEEGQPSQTAPPVEKDLYEDVEELANSITQYKDSFTEGEMDTKVTPEQLSIPVIDLDKEPQTRSNTIEIIELSDDDEEDKEDIRAYHKYDPNKVMWCYEFPQGKRNGPFSLTDLKRWSDEEYFVQIPDFKVWMTGTSIKSGVLLTTILSHIKT